MTLAGDTGGGPQRGVARLARVNVVIEQAPIIPEVRLFIAFCCVIVHGKQSRQ